MIVYIPMHEQQLEKQITQFHIKCMQHKHY